MRALVIGAGMGGLFAALALRKSGRFTSVDVFEQTDGPSTAGAGLNIPPNGARLCRELGVDLDGGDPKGEHGAVDGGRAAILDSTRMVMDDGTISVKPLDHNTKADDGAGFHHMHRLDLLMCLVKRCLEFGPESGEDCPIEIHYSKRLESVSQTDDVATANFRDDTSYEGELIVGADGINSKTRTLVCPDAPPKRWTYVVCYRGLIPREKVAKLTKEDGSPMDYNPINSYSMDSRKNKLAYAMSYWVRGGEYLNVWLAYYEPDSTEFEGDDGDWFPVEHAELIGNMGKAFKDDCRMDDVLALAGGMENPTKWGLYDNDAFPSWHDGRVVLLGDAAHAILPTYGQGAALAFEDGAALGKAFELHGDDVYSANLHYERVRHYRATRVQFASKFLFKHLEPEDTPQRRQILKALDERDFPTFDHEKRAGGDDSWLYAYDAQVIGDKIPGKRLGPWDFRSAEAVREARSDVMRNLWVPEVSLKGDRKVTMKEIQQHTSFEDCWIIINGKVYDISEWKDHHPGGPFVARMYGGKDATAEFGTYHSKLAERHMAHFCVGELVGTESPVVTAETPA
jgi:salicylate hydroxylase